ncbi:MAG TPA: DinB family protein [Candidatus Acidoferrales bacterium]|nr:DinB family protein [Candidatus Acidoferrales bacterium]
MPRPSFTIEQLLTILAETPRRIADITKDAPPTALHTAPHDEWSANDVLAHLRACADVWGGNIARMLAEDRPTWKAVNPRTWIESTDYASLQFQPSLRAFAEQRAALLAALHATAPKGWSRTAIVTGGGSPLQLTVLDFAQRLARHERPHVKQVTHVVAAMHA